MQKIVKIILKLIIVFIYIISSITPSLATIFYSCSISPQTINFGSINNTTVRAFNISVTCTTIIPSTVNYTLTFSTGLSNNYALRTMMLNTNNLNYQLFDPTGQVILGNGTSGTSTLSKSYFLSSNQTDSYIIYGVIINQPLAPRGTYTDTLTATLNCY